ncbi:MAG: LacI family transcriptional regulator [bacterium]|nr:LacI family transcriptional regulator [bacterium]MCS7309078.1 LacI family transcriptional regulator [Armatimonadota bacterium]
MGAGRWRQIAENLQAQIERGEWRTGDRLPPETELARRWGVSRMTVQRAMHELQRLGLVQRRRRAGTVVTSARMKRAAGYIALLAHHSQDLLEMAYLRGIQSGLPEEVHLIVCDTQGDAEREASYLRRMAKEADGIILFPTCDPENTPLLIRLLESGSHIVCIDRYPEGVSVDAFVTDNYQSTLEAMRYLVARGVAPIAHLSHPDLHIPAVRERYQAYLDALREAGFPQPERWVRWIPGVPPCYTPYLVQIVADALVALRCHTPSLRAVFCVNDHYLMATLEACAQLKLTVPDDLQILSFQDTLSLLPQMARSIHRLVQQPLELGKQAALRLRSSLEGRMAEPTVVRLPAQFYPAVVDANSVKGG